MVDSPFWNKTKTEIVGWYLAQGLPPEHLLLTFSCSSTDGQRTHCGACSSCLRRWTSLANNGIEGQFDNPPWNWNRVRSYYLPAMRRGRYPAHRAAELFAALRTVGITVDRQLVRGQLYATADRLSLRTRTLRGTRRCPDRTEVFGHLLVQRRFQHGLREQVQQPIRAG
jgi:hypothetical protein